MFNVKRAVSYTHLDVYKRQADIPAMEIPEFTPVVHAGLWENLPKPFRSKFPQPPYFCLLYTSKQYRVKRNGVEGYFECGECGKVYTVRTGTIFERSHVPLHKWIRCV